jgi:zinc transport system substrate-binding protein
MPLIKWTHWLLIGALISILLLLSGCVQETDESGKIGVIVTIPPQSEMVEAIGGDRIEVTVMVPAGKSPHTYVPIPSQMTAVAEAEVYMKVGSGVEFEINYMDEIIDQNRDMKIVDCSEGVQLIDISDHLHPGEEEGHNNRGKDPHIWLSPDNVKKMVGNMLKGLIEVDPEGQDTYESNYDKYLERLDELDSDIEDRFEGREGDSFLVYHPAWGYFADAYDLQQLAIEEEGKDPGPAGVAAIVGQAKEYGIKAIFVSPQFSQESAKTIAEEIGGEVIAVDPMAPDYIDNLRQAADRLSQGLSG